MNSAQIHSARKGADYLDRRRWEHLWDVHLRCKSRCLFEEIARRYSEPHRHYHNARHINEGLDEFDAARVEALNPLAVEFAIWFHDVIYDPKAHDNEERSALYAVQCLAEAGADLSGQVASLIRATKTHFSEGAPDAELLIDIDLSILGTSPERFREFEEGIRKEFAWVPVDVYRSKRAEILRGFFERERIYQRKSFYDRYEAAARRNIAGLIAELR